MGQSLSKFFMRLCLLFCLLCFIILKIFEWSPVTLHFTHSFRLTCLTCSKHFTCANSFFLPCWIFKCIFQLVTTKTLLLKLNCPFFPVRTGKYNIYLLFISFLINGIIKGISKEPSSKLNNCSCSLTMEINGTFSHDKSSWKPLIYVFGLLSPSTGLKQNLSNRKLQDLPC